MIRILTPAQECEVAIFVLALRNIATADEFLEACEDNA